MFANLAYEVRESVQPQTAAAGQTTLPSMTGSTLTATANAPGVIAWSIKGSFVPVLEFIPPDPKAQPKPGAPAPGAPPPATAANPQPAAANPQTAPPAAKPAS